MAEYVCRTCVSNFTVTEDEQRLLERLAPTIGGQTFPFPQSKDCPHCRFIHRSAFLNERNLYYRPCDKTGKTVVSNYAPESKHTVYFATYWLSDDWDAQAYAQELNFDEPFFTQYRRLFAKVPRMSIDQANMVNSDFNNHVDNLKDCYMCVQCGNLENCTYDSYVYGAKNCHDCVLMNDSEGCYTCLNSSDCYEVFFAENTNNSATSMFLKNCESMKDSLMCVNMRHQQYCVRNKQVTKEEFEAERLALLTRMQSDLTGVQAEFDAFAAQFPQPPHLNRRSEDCDGEYLDRCKNCHDAFLGMRSENVYHAYWFVNAKDCIEIDSFDMERSYFGQITGGNSYNCHFCVAAWDNCKDVFYSDYCFFDCEGLFGCVGLKRKKYCILNKQYTKEEYETLVPKLIAHMQTSGEWGEFFPMDMSPFAYNESVAQLHAPLEENAVTTRGLRWRALDQIRVQEKQVSLENIEAYREPAKAQELLGQVLTCIKTGQPYRMVSQELAFLLQHNLPIPRVAPRQRYIDMLVRMNPIQQTERQCMNAHRQDTGGPCQNMFLSSHPENGGAIVYCEECYRAAFL